MADFINPVPTFWDLVHVFTDGAEADEGITIDQDLCAMMAEVLTDAAQGVEALVAFARSHGHVGAFEEATALTRTPVQRQQLARLAISHDPGACVVAFPAAPVRRVLTVEGGSAA